MNQSIIDETINSKSITFSLFRNINRVFYLQNMHIHYIKHQKRSQNVCSQISQISKTFLSNIAWQVFTEGYFWHKQHGFNNYHQLKIKVHKPCMFLLSFSSISMQCKLKQLLEKQNNKEKTLLFGKFWKDINKRFGFAGKAISSVQNSGNPNIFIGTTALAY